MQVRVCRIGRTALTVILQHGSSGLRHDAVSIFGRCWARLPVIAIWNIRHHSAHCIWCCTCTVTECQTSECGTSLHRPVTFTCPSIYILLPNQPGKASISLGGVSGTISHRRVSFTAQERAPAVTEAANLRAFTGTTRRRISVRSLAPRGGEIVRSATPLAAR